MKTVRGSIVGVGLLSGVLIAAGCATKGQTGALLGGAAGAGLGQAFGGDTGSTVAGGALGAGVGYIAGNEMDKADAAAERRMLSEQANTMTVNVRNSNGSTTPVRLRRVGDRWMGPNGEYYDSIPTQEQLRGLYGF